MIISSCAVALPQAMPAAIVMTKTRPADRHVVFIACSEGGVFDQEAGAFGLVARDPAACIRNQVHPPSKPDARLAATIGGAKS